VTTECLIWKGKAPNTEWRTTTAETTTMSNNWGTKTAKMKKRNNTKLTWIQVQIQQTHVRSAPAPLPLCPLFLSLSLSYTLLSPIVFRGCWQKWRIQFPLTYTPKKTQREKPNIFLWLGNFIWLKNLKNVFKIQNTNTKLKKKLGIGKSCSVLRKLVITPISTQMLFWD